MANIYKGTLGLVGNTPLVEVVNVEKALGLEATVLVKLEYLNPAGSVKDRIAKGMIEDADKPKTLHSSCKYPTPQEHLPSNLRHPLLTQFFQLFHKELLLSLHLLSLHQAFPKLPALPDSLSISSHF